MIDDRIMKSFEKMILSKNDSVSVSSVVSCDNPAGSLLRYLAPLAISATVIDAPLHAST